MTDQEKRERQAFEKWADNKFLGLLQPFLRKRKNDDYFYSSVQCAFSAYCAGRADQREKIEHRLRGILNSTRSYDGLETKIDELLAELIDADAAAIRASAEQGK